MSPIFLTRVWITQTTYSCKSPLSLHLVEYIQSRFLRETVLPSVVMLAVKNTSSYACCPFSKMKQKCMTRKSKATSEKAMQQLYAGMEQQVASMGWSNVLCGEMKQWGPLWATWEPHRPAAPPLPGLHLLGHAAWQQEFPATVPSQRSFSQRNVQWQGKWYWPWIPSMPGIFFLHTIPNIQWSDCRIMLQVI